MQRLEQMLKEGILLYVKTSSRMRIEFVTRILIRKTAEFIYLLIDFRTTYQ